MIDHYTVWKYMNTKFILFHSREGDPLKSVLKKKKNQFWSKKDMVMFLKNLFGNPDDEMTSVFLLPSFRYIRGP